MVTILDHHVWQCSSPWLYIIHRRQKDAALGSKYGSCDIVVISISLWLKINLHHGTKDCTDYIEDFAVVVAVVVRIIPW